MGNLGIPDEQVSEYQKSLNAGDFLVGTRCENRGLLDELRGKWQVIGAKRAKVFT